MSRLFIAKEFGFFGKTFFSKEDHAAGSAALGTNDISLPLNAEERKKITSYFGTTPFICEKIWALLFQFHLIPAHGTPYHFLWSLMFLKMYSNENVLAGIAETTPKNQTLYRQPF